MKMIFQIKKIRELDNRSQFLLDILIGMKKDISERFVGLDKTDESLLTKLNSLDTDNHQKITTIRNNFDIMIKELEAKNSENQDSMKKETLAITQEIAKRGWGPNKDSPQQAGAELHFLSCVSAYGWTQLKKETEKQIRTD